MLDRLWWIWQMLHPALARTIEGTVTMNNNPPSANATVRDRLDVKGLLTSEVLLQDVLDTMGGEPLCYVYN